MSGPMKGRADFWQEGDWNAVCYECGRKRKASEMKKHWQGYYVCPEHWEMRQPQDFVRGVPDRQTVDWAQPVPSDAFAQETLFIEESGSVTIIVTVGTTLILVIGEGVVVDLTLDGGAGTVISNNFGKVTSITNNALAAFIEQGPGEYPSGPAPQLLDLVAGEIGVAPGRALGFAAGLVGSLTPNTISGAVVVILASQEAIPPSGAFGVLLLTPELQDFFTSITLNGFTYLTSAASYSLPGGQAQWLWSVVYGVEPISTPGAYVVTVN
jgi:hypothetical protein